MLTFNLKKEWFEKIKSGEKTHEYREVKPYWFRRLFLYSKELCRQTTIPLHNTCIFACVDTDVFDIEFELIKE